MQQFLHKTKLSRYPNKAVRYDPVGVGLHTEVPNPSTRKVGSMQFSQVGFL